MNVKLSKIQCSRHGRICCADKRSCYAKLYVSIFVNNSSLLTTFTIRAQMSATVPLTTSWSVANLQTHLILSKHVHLVQLTTAKLPRTGVVKSKRLQCACTMCYGTIAWQHYYCYIRKSSFVLHFVRHLSNHALREQTLLWRLVVPTNNFVSIIANVLAYFQVLMPSNSFLAPSQ